MKRIYLILIVLMVAEMTLMLSSCSKSSKVDYHKAEVQKEYDQYLNRKLPDDERKKHYTASIEHRNKLVELGYYEKRKFVLNHMHSEEKRRKFLTAIPENKEFAESWYELAGKSDKTVTPSGYLIVWDRPSSMNAWVEFVKKYDVEAPSSQPSEKKAVE